MKTINSLAELPSQFDIAKYAVTEGFGLQEWASNICHRVGEAHNTDHFREMLDEYPSMTEEIRRARALTIDTWLELIDAPIQAVEHPNQHAITGFLREKVVFDVDMLDYVLMRPQFGDRMPDEIDPVQPYQALYDKWFGRDYISTPPEERDKAHATLTLTPYWRVIGARSDGSNMVTFNGGVMVNVDLHATDEKLAADFMEWVRKTREDLSISGRTRVFGKADFERWNRYRVLAYFDIAYWAKLAGVKITDYAMGLALFPNEIDSANPADRVRQTVRPLVEELFAVSTSTALANQALGAIQQS